MTNGEKYKNFIEEHVKADQNFAIVNDIPRECLDAKCPDCMFFMDSLCDNQILKFYSWLNTEAKKLIKLTEKEYNFCKMVKDGFLVRNMDETLWYFEAEPTRDADLNWTAPEYITRFLITTTNSLEFSFISNQTPPVATEELIDFYKTTQPIIDKL